MINSVELLGHYGSDEVIACSGWSSTSRSLDAKKRDRIPAFINDLWKAGHETPFEKGLVHFLVNCDIASHIHFLKHRMSSLNAESARYKELKEDKFFIPNDWGDIVATENIPQFEIEGSTWSSILEDFTNMSNSLYHTCLKDLAPVLGRKRAKESARFFKTYNSQIQADVSFNMRSFANFLNLRKSDNAQVEIRDLATAMLELVRNIPNNPFEHTLNAWGHSKNAL